MNGPKHYADAETLLRAADEASAEALATLRADASMDPTPSLVGVLGLVLAAQVHATLAHAAAVAEMDAFGMADGSATGRTVNQVAAWVDAFGGAS